MRSTIRYGILTEYNFGAVDPDAGDAVTMAIIGIPSPYLTMTNGFVCTTSLPVWWATTPTISLTITATDLGGLTSTVNITIAVSGGRACVMHFRTTCVCIGWVAPLVQWKLQITPYPHPRQ